jgi:hypothetical protein
MKRDTKRMRMRRKRTKEDVEERGGKRSGAELEKKTP